MKMEPGWLKRALRPAPGWNVIENPDEDAIVTVSDGTNHGTLWKNGFIHTTGLPVEATRWLVAAWDLYRGSGSEFSLCEAEALRSRGIAP